MKSLNIGGNHRGEGDWVTLSIEEGEGIDIIRNASDLSCFEDESFDQVYSSHALEHFTYRSIPQVLKEWARVLKPGGKLYIAVPDLVTLAFLFLHPHGDLETRFEVMRMMFGGHVDLHDIHLAGLYEELLAHFLTLAGFQDMVRVDSFGFFEDMSVFAYNNTPISLNIVATKDA